MKHSALATAIKLASTGVLAGALVACGGGSGGGGQEDTTSSGTSIGSVSGFGSVYVNGTHFNTGSATVRSDDGIDRVRSDDGTDVNGQLEKGMIVKVRGSWDDSTGEGEATEIEYDDTLRGPVESATWDGTTNTGVLTVAGLKVKLDGLTVFRGATAEELTDPTGNYRVRISAWPLANDPDFDFRASFVGAGNASTPLLSDDLDHEVEVKGVVFELGVSGSQTFRLNSAEGLLVNYNGQVETDDDFSLDQIEDGIGVEVEGKLEGGVLIASEIDREDDFFGLNGDIEIQGPIEADYNDQTNQFVLNGVIVQFSSDDFRDGLQASDLVAGFRVKVEGSFNNQNVLVAREIEPKEGDAEVEATIESIDRVNETMVVGGVNVALTNSTIIEDDNADSRRREKELENLNSGDFVEVEGRFRNGVLEAVSIELEDDADAEFDMDGRATFDENSVRTIIVLGLELELQPSSTLDLSQFDDKAVEVKYEKVGGNYLINEIHLDLPDDGSGSGSDDNGVDDNGSTDDNNGVDQTPG